MKKLAIIILVSATVVATGTLGFAVSDSATDTINFSVNPQQSLRIKSNTSSSTSDTTESVFHIPSPDDEEIEKGRIIKQNAIRLVATSNVEWAVQVRAKSPTLGTGNSGYRKPVSDLSVRGQGGFEQLSTSPVNIASGEPGEHEFGVDYKVRYNEDYKSGNYKAELVYNISTA